VVCIDSNKIEIMPQLRTLLGSGPRHGLRLRWAEQIYSHGCKASGGAGWIEVASTKGTCGLRRVLGRMRPISRSRRPR